MPRALARWLASPWARVALTVGVFVALSRFVDLASLAARARGADPVWLVAAVVMFGLDQALGVYKWQLLLGGLGLEVGFGPLFRTATSGMFLSFFVPSALSADLYKGVAASRTLGAGAEVASSIVLERLLGVASIVVVGLLSLSWLPRAVLGFDSAVTLGLAAAVLAGGLAGFLHADVLLRFLEGRLPRAFAGLAARLEDLARAFGAYRRRRRTLVACFLLSLALQGTRCTATWMIARSLGDATPFWAFLVFVPYLYMVNLLPFATSRIGLEQGAFVLLFATVGMAPEVAVAVSLLSVLAGLVVALPGGLWLVTDRAALGTRSSR
ncbi:MAG TPA: lysylphosphatidylglycerol synthase transmembrane domain-containing protein [Myxococcota bacterium]|jgi:uncharacterized protein (TIRG00374 family)|nr:lysylphosphatidylglycerol synthase transmembrane domain-containing protein [Myxococcota bacterium]